MCVAIVLKVFHYFFADSQGNLGQESRESSGVCSFGVFSLLHCNQSVWMDCKHGKDHEGSGPP